MSSKGEEQFGFGEQEAEATLNVPDHSDGGAGAPVPSTPAQAGAETTSLLPLDKGAAVSSSNEALFQSMQLNSALLEACRKGSLEKTRQAVEQGASVNHVTAFKETPLHFAAASGSESTLAYLLEQGARPNQRNAQGKTPLAVAASKGTRVSCKALVTAGSDPVHALRHVTIVSEGVKTDAAAILVSEGCLLRSGRPIRQCFQAALLLGRLADQQKERRVFYQGLQRLAQDLATELLAECRDLWDVRRLLATNTGVLAAALACRQKQFIAHPFAQEYLTERWLGPYADLSGTAAWLRVTTKYLLFPVLLPLGALQHVVLDRNLPLKYTRLGDYLRLLRLPFFRFFGHTASFLVFLALLVVVITDESRAVPSRRELALGVWVLALCASEARQFWASPLAVYLRSLWNVLDVVMLGFYLVTIGLRALVYFGVALSSEELDLQAANVVLAFAALLTSMRLLNVMQSHHLLGPLQLAIRATAMDLANFLAILVVFILGFSLALTKLFQGDRAQLVESGEFFGSLPRSLRTLFWAMFGLVEPFDILADGRSPPRVVGEIVYGFFVLTCLILLLPLLIAKANTSFQMIHDNADVEFKFARAILIRDYELFPASPPPFNVIMEPAIALLQMLGVSVAFEDLETAVSTDRKEDERMLLKLLEQLVARVQAARGAQDAQKELASLREEVSGLRHDMGQIMATLETLAQRP